MQSKSSKMSVKALILIGGPSTHPAFHSLTMESPAPFFPVAGLEILYHLIANLAEIEQVSEVFLVGFYKKSLLEDFLQKVNRDFDKIITSYIYEDERLGTGGTLCKRLDFFFDANTSHILFVHGDIATNISFSEVLAYHKNNDHPITLVANRLKNVIRNPDEFPHSYRNYGCLFKDEDTDELIHYVEKPEDFSLKGYLINSGVYVISAQAKPILLEGLNNKRVLTTQQTASEYINRYLKTNKQGSFDYLSLERDIIFPNTGKSLINVWEITNPDTFLFAIKTPQDALRCSERLLHHYVQNPGIYQKSGNLYTEKPDLVLLESKVPESCKLGPHVVIGKGVHLGQGVRIRNAIILDGVTIRDGAFISNAIIGWNSDVGYWCRIEGTAEKDRLNQNDRICVLGVGVVIKDEVHVRNSIAVSYGVLDKNHDSEIVLF